MSGLAPTFTTTGQQAHTLRYCPSPTDLDMEYSPNMPIEEKPSKRQFFKRNKKEPVPTWKREQEKKFKDWEKARSKQSSSTRAFTDFYRPSKTNKGWWVFWL